MERLVYLFSGGNVKVIQDMMREMETKGKVNIPHDAHTKVSQIS